MTRKSIAIGLILSSLAPLLLLMIINYYPSSTTTNADGSVSVSAQWMSFTFTSYLFTALCIFICYMTIAAAINKLRIHRNR